MTTSVITALEQNSMEELLRQLLATVSTLQNDVNELKEGLIP